MVRMHTPLGCEPSCRNSIRPCQFAADLCSEPPFFFFFFFLKRLPVSSPAARLLLLLRSDFSSSCGIHGEAITGIPCRVETGLLYQPRISPHFPSAPSVCVQMAHSHQADSPTSASNLFISPQTEPGLWEESLPTPDPCPLGPLAGEQRRQR